MAKSVRISRRSSRIARALACVLTAGAAAVAMQGTAAAEECR